MVFNIPDEHSSKSGIYIIVNTETNNKYIGSAVNLYKRFTLHYDQLNNGSHGNIYLSRAYKKYGPDTFIFLLHELVPKELLLIREQHHLDYCLNNFDYNIAKIAGSQFGCKRSPESIERMRLAQEKSGAKHYKLINPDGESIDVFNLAKFVRDNNLGKSINSLVCGRVSTAYGYTLHKDDPNYRPPKKIFTLITPEGKVITVINLSDFARRHNLKLSSIYDVAAGNKREYNGYKPSKIRNCLINLDTK